MNIKKITPEQKHIRMRILEISYEKRYSHLGSNLSAVDIIHAVYSIKSQDDRFVLSSGHAGLALYVVLESKGYIAPAALRNLTIHPDRNIKFDIPVSSGSLGHGLPIAVGIAMANRERIVYCLITDGECAEGSIWEALRVAKEYRVTNLKIIVNANGWSAYSSVNVSSLVKRFRGFGYRILLVDGHNICQMRSILKRKEMRNPLLVVAKTSVEQFSFLKGQDAHYYIMSDLDYKMAMEILQ